MKITKAVITTAGTTQRTLPLQTLIDRDGSEKAVLEILIGEAVQAGISDIGLVIRPGDEQAYHAVAGEHGGRLTFIPQTEPLGYGHAIYTARTFVKNEPFLHLVGDHLYVSRGAKGCTQQLVETAEAEACTVSTVQATRESQLPYYGTVGGGRIHGQPHLYRVTTVLEKPTPTTAEEQLIVSGLRAGHYLCFFGMHVLTSAVLDILGQLLRQAADPLTVTLSQALNQLASREKYLALEIQDRRYDVGVKYGLLEAQLALALNGRDRDEVLTKLVTLLAER